MTSSNKELEGDGGWDEYSSELTSGVGGASPTHSAGRASSNPAWLPFTYVSAVIPPMWIIHGTDDEIVPVESVDEFVNVLREKGAGDLTYLRVEGGNHGTAYEHHLDVTKPAMDAFFERTLKNVEN
jgi:acetyl esterase/lipase